MSGRRSVLLGLVTWVVVVAVGSTVVWAVISRAGDGVVSSVDPGFPSSPAGTGSPQESPSSTPSGSSAPTGSPAAPVVERRTWEGTAGRVVVECTGPVASLAGAQPAAGYDIDFDDRGPDRVEVEFEAGDDSDSRRRVRATCAAGIPVFEIDD